MKTIWDLFNVFNLIPHGVNGYELKDRELSWAVRPAGRMFSSGGSGSKDSGKRTQRVQRRRRTDSGTDQERRRAPAPSLRREKPPSRPEQASGGTGGAGRPPSFHPSSLGGLPGGGRSPLLIIGLLIIALICIVPILLILRPGDSTNQESYPTSMGAVDLDTTQSETPLATLEPFKPPQIRSADGTWLVMLYQNADDKILEQDIFVDLNEAERVGSNDRVHIVAQLDRYRAGFTGDGNWSTTRRYYLTPDPDLDRLRSQVVADLGETNMADGDTLVDFVTWAVETFPADNHVLILSDHGMGWPGGWSDDDPDAAGDRSIPFSASIGDRLYLMELDQALETIRTRTGIGSFQLIGMDACLMGHLEVFSALAPHARFAVASQDNEPSLGWAYTSFLSALAENPDMSAAELSRLIVESYIESDQRIVDDQERAELLRQGSPLGSLFSFMGSISADQLANQMSKNITLSAVDLAAMPGLVNNLNTLAYRLQSSDQAVVARARNYAQTFTSIFGDKVPPSYIDLGSFSQILTRESNDPGIKQAAEAVLTSINSTVLAEKHGPEKSGATGISVYFPNSQLYSSAISGAESYTAIADRFASVSLWDDYLAYHYTGRPFTQTAAELVIPESGTAIRAPGSGDITISSLSLSNNVATPEEPILISADISGDNIGYIYLFVGFYDQNANAIYVIDRDYLESDQPSEVDGVYYPEWGEGEFTMEFEWEPVVFAVNDGVISYVALFAPDSYGATYEEAVYTVDGIYSYADGSETRHARLYFRDGWLRQVFGFSNANGTGEPREIIPQSGDTFTILENWLELDSSGRVQQAVTQEGGTLTFGDQMFSWEVLDAPVGDYLVGFVVEDLDGNSIQAYDRVRVE